MKRRLGHTTIAVLVFGLSACAAGSDAAHQAAQGGAVSEVVLGFWHGLIAPLTLLIEVINAVAPHTIPWSPAFYENAGGVTYDVGFFFGLVVGPSILWTGASRRR